MNPQPCVSVIIVTYESRDFVGGCLESVYRSGDWLKECWVVDNASRDGTADLIRLGFPAVNIIANTDNIGFGRAVNLAAQRASGEFLLILNPDTDIQTNAIGELVEFLQHRPQACACGPLVTSPDGHFRNDSRRGFPTPLNAFGYFSGLDRLFPHSRTLGGYHRRWLRTDLEVTTDCLSGSCMLVRRKQFEAVGGFDDDYFLFGEDIDLCWKLRESGYEIWFVPSARIVHAKGASMRFAPMTARREFYRSMRLFMDKRLSTRYPKIVLSAVKVGVRFAELLSSRYRMGNHRRASVEPFGSKKKGI